MTGTVGSAHLDAGPWVESPPHVDDVRMRHITDRHLLESLDLTAAGLDAVASAGDTDQALRAWRGYRAGGSAPLPVADIGRWARRRRSRPSPPPADGVLRDADALMHEPVDFLDAGLGRSSFYGFHYLRWMMPLLEAYALTGRAEYAARYGELFSAWYAARDDVVGDWPGLDVIWYSLGVWSRSAMFTQAISLLSGEPAFPDEQWRQTMKCLLGGARWAAEEHVTFRNGNWQLVSVSEVAHTAAVYPEFAEHDAWREVARRRIEDHLELDFYADGCHFERSPGYHLMCLNALGVAALSADPEQWPLAEHPRLRAAYDWLASMAHPPGWVPHLQDSGIIRPAQALLVGHHLFGVPAWKWMAQRWMDSARVVDELDRLGPRPDGTDPVEFFETAPSAPPDDASILLGPSGHAVLRQGWGFHDLTTVVNVGPYVGHELEPHSHHASLDFVISGWGEPLAWEAGGPPTYDDAGYYSWYQHGRGHNSVVLDGEPNSAERNTVVESFWSLSRGHDGVDVVAGRHDAFAQRHRREMVFIRSDPGYWLVVDDLGGRPITSTWTIHGRAPWTAQGERRYVAGSAPGLVVIPAEAPADAELGSGPARLPASQVALPGDDPDGVALSERRERADEHRTIHSLHLSGRQGVLRTVLVPFRDDAPDVAVEASGDGSHVEVRLGAVRDRIGSGSWVRVHDDGRSEQARWDIDPERPDAPSRDAAAPAIIGTGLLAWWCRAGSDGVVAEVVTDRRAVVTVHSAAIGPLTVNGVRVSSGDDGPRQVTLPSQGRWRLELSADSDE